MAFAKDTGFTAVLLHFDATDYSVTVSDETNKTWTIGGGGSQRTTQYKFGTSSMYFDGIDDRILTADHADFYLVADLTLDVWLRFEDFPVSGSYYQIWEQYQDGNNWQTLCFKNDGGNHTFIWQIRTGGADDVLVSSACASNLSLSTWYHVRICRYGNDYKIYVNGAKIGATVTDASAVANFTGTVWIGCHNAATNFFKGYMDEFRIINGKAVVTGDSFDVPCRAYSPHLDDAYTIHNLHFDAPDGKTSLCDESGISWSCVNNAAIDTAQSVFGGSSLALDGTADCISTPDAATIYLGVSDFCLEMFARFAALPGAGAYATLWCHQTNTTNRMMMILYNNGGSYELRCEVWEAGVCLFQAVQAIAAMAIDTWFHLCWNRESLVHRLFCDSAQLGADAPDSTSIPNYTGVLYLGTVDGTNSAVNGWIDEYRLSVGTSRGGASFTQPTAAYGPNISQTNSITVDDSYQFIDNTIVIDLPLKVIDIDSHYDIQIIDFDLPLLDVAITGKTGWYGTVNIPLPIFVPSFNGLTGEVASIELDLPLKTLAYQGAGKLALSLPQLVTAANLLVGTAGQINAFLPKIALGLTGYLNNIGQISITMPVKYMASIGKMSQVGQIGFALPAPVIRLTGLSGSVGQIDFDLPRLRINVSSYINGNMTMDVTIPSLIVNLHGILRPTSVTYKGVVVNLKTMAVTEYAGFNFNSLGSIGGSGFGANSAGLYQFTGNALSEASFMTGAIDLGSSVLSRPQAVWLTLRADGALIMTVVVDENTTYTYNVTGLPDRIHEERVKIGKGIKERYASFGLKNVDAADFDISTIALFADKVISKKR